MAKSFESKRNLTGGEYKQKLYFVPCADKEPKVGHEISEPAIFRFLHNEETHLEKFDGAEIEIPKMLDVLKDIDKQSKITKVEVHESSMGKVSDKMKAFHAFIVFKSTSEKDRYYWWSLEKNTKYIVLQRSRNKDSVNFNFEGEKRNKTKLVKFIFHGFMGKGTIQDLFEILIYQQLIAEKYNILNSNCQSLVTFVGQQITNIGYKYKGNFKYYPTPEKGRDKQMLKLINVITGYSDYPPLFHLIKMGNTDLVDKTVASGQYDINALYNGLTPLHLAIKSEKPEMVQHLLQPPLNADPTRRDASGKSALLLAASMFEMNAEIIDLLLAHDKVNVDDVDENGQTALHLAVSVSNVIAVRKLLEKGANPNIFNKNASSPLHVAALLRWEAEIFDLLVVHDKFNVDHADENGKTALHVAASFSNVIAVQKLLGKGANPNIFNNKGKSPLHVAARQRGGNPIIDLLLEAQKVRGIGDVNDANKQGRTALHYAAAYSNEITAEHLIEKGANVNCRTNIGLTPLDMAALCAKEIKIIDLLLQNINEIDAIDVCLTPLDMAVLGAKDMNIIDVLLRNINEGDIQQYKNNQRLFFFARHNLHGLGNTILGRLVKKGINKPPFSTETDDCFTAESDETADDNTRRFVLDKGADPSIDLTGFDGLDFLIARVKISLGIYGEINRRDQKGETPLLVAIRVNNVNAVRNLLERGADPTIRDRKGFTPFLPVLLNNDTAIRNLLLESGKVDINETTSQEGWTALYKAIITSNVTAAAFLLSKGANPNLAEKDGSTPLHLAAMFAKDMDVELILNYPGVDVNLMDDDGYSALDFAMNNGQHGKRIANRLKEKGAVERELPKISNETLKKLENNTIINAADEIENCIIADDTIPIEDKIARIEDEHLISIIIDSDVETLRLLLKKGVDISSARGKYRMNALHVASIHAKTTDLIDAILETGKFDINGVDKDGWTPLYYAIMGSNSARNAPHLIRLGADPNVANKTRVTPLHLAAKNEETAELIDIILETGQCNINTAEATAAVNPVDNDGRTPLHYAIERPDPVTINARRLIEMGADPGIADKNGITPLHMAARNAKSMDLIEILLKTEAVDVNCVDIKGRTPLAYARDNEHGLGQRIIARLKEYCSKN